MGSTGEKPVKPGKIFASAPQRFPTHEAKKYHSVNPFNWKREKLTPRNASPASRVLVVRMPEGPQRKDAISETHGPKMEDVATHLLGDYGIMGVSAEEDSAKWAAEQIRNSTKGSKEVTGNSDNSVLKNQSKATKLQVSENSQVSKSGAVIQGNSSENQQERMKETEVNLTNTPLALKEKQCNKTTEANQSLEGQSRGQNTNVLVELNGKDGEGGSCAIKTTMKVSVNVKVSNSSSVDRANASENHEEIIKQAEDRFPNISLTLKEKENNNSAETNQSSNGRSRDQNKTILVEPNGKETSKDGEAASLALNIGALRPGQSFDLKLPNGFQNNSLAFSRDNKGDVLQNTIFEHIEPVNNSKSFKMNSASEVEGNTFGTVEENHGSGGNANSIVTTVEYLNNNLVGSQRSTEYPVINDESHSVNLQGQGKMQTPTGSDNDKLEVYDDESLAKALKDSSASSIVLSNKNIMGADTYLLGSEAQKKSIPQREKSSTRKEQSEEQNAIRRYLTSKKFSKNRRHKQNGAILNHKKHSLKSQIEKLTQRNAIATHVLPPEGSEALQSRDSESNAQLTSVSNKELSRGNASPPQKTNNYTVSKISSSTVLHADTPRNNKAYQGIDPAITSTSNERKRNESHLLPSGFSQRPIKINEESLNNGLSGNQHEGKATTNVLIQDDSGRAIYHGAVDIFKDGSNMSSGIKELQYLDIHSSVSNKVNEHSQGFPSTQNANTQSNQENSLPNDKGTEQSRIISGAPSFANISKTGSNPVAHIPDDKMSHASVEQQENNSRSDTQKELPDIHAKDSSTQRVPPQQNVGIQEQQYNENPPSQHQENQLNAGENYEEPLLSEEQREKSETLKNLKEKEDHEEQQQIYLQNQYEDLNQQKQPETNHPNNGEPQHLEPTYEEDKSLLQEDDVYHIVLHNGNKIFTSPSKHVVLTISEPLPSRMTKPANSNAPLTDDMAQGDLQNNKHSDKMVLNLHGHLDISSNSGAQKSSPNAKVGNYNVHVPSNEERLTQEDRHGTSNQTKVGNTNNSIQSRLNEPNPNDHSNKQGVNQSTSQSSEQDEQNKTKDPSLKETGHQVVNLTSEMDNVSHRVTTGRKEPTKYTENIFIRPEDATVQQGPEKEEQTENLVNQADGRLISNVVVKPIDGAAASLSSSVQGFASNGETGAREGEGMTGAVVSASPQGQKMDCHVSPNYGKTSITILTCRRKKDISNTPQALKPDFYNSQPDQSLAQLSEGAQGRIPRLDEVLNALNEDMKNSLNKEVLIEGNDIRKMLNGLGSPSASLYDPSAFATSEGPSVFDWMPESHRKNYASGFVGPPWRMNPRGRALWDPVHHIMLPSSLLTNYWRHLKRRRPTHRRHPLRSGRGFWGFHPHFPLNGYDNRQFVPFWSPHFVGIPLGNFLRGTRHKKLQAYHQENASKRTSLFNNVLKGDRDNCRPHAGGLHSHMGEWEYLGRVLCSCPFGVGEW